MNNVQLNGNMFMNISAFVEHKASLAMQTVDTLAKSSEESRSLDKRPQYKQEKAQF